MKRESFERLLIDLIGFAYMKKIGNFIWNMIESIARFFLVKLFRIKFTEKSWEAFMQFVKFGIVGVSNTLLGYLLYVGSLLGLRKVHWIPKYDFLVAQLVEFILSVLWSFYWNNKMVFKQQEGEKRNIFAALMKTYISYAFTSLFLAEVLLWFFVKVMGVNEFIAPFIGLIVTIPLNFLIQKFWAFRKKEA